MFICQSRVIERQRRTLLHKVSVYKWLGCCVGVDTLSSLLLSPPLHSPPLPPPPSPLLPSLPLCSPPLPLPSSSAPLLSPPPLLPSPPPLLLSSPLPFARTRSFKGDIGRLLAYGVGRECADCGDAHQCAGEGEGKSYLGQVN